MFSSSSVTRSIPEGQSSGRPIGATVTATDLNPSDSLTYTLEGTDAASFSIHSRTGQLRTGDPLDQGTKSTYTVTVRATDRDGLSDTIMVTITVTEAEEQMGEVTLWDGMVALTMAPQVGDTITGAVMDPDVPVNVTAWQWARTTTPDVMASWMDIDGATEAAYMVMEGDTGHHLRVMATYTDAVGTDMAMEYSPATMMVTAVGEMMGEVILWASATEALRMAPQVGATITGAVMDPDVPVNVTAWQWARTTTPDVMASWMDIDGATEAAYTVTEGDTGYYLRVMATYTDAVGTDTAMVYSMPTMMVGAEAGDTLLDRYDANNNRQIDRPEVLDAIRDFVFNQTIERDDVVDVIRLFIFSR